VSELHHYTLEIHYVNQAPQTRRFEARRVVIGRDGGDIVLGDSQASAAHAEIEFENGQIVVRDLGSTNGTWLGQRQLPQFALSPGQVFRCGHTHIRLLEIVGGQQLVAGRTVMADAGSLPPLTAPGQQPPGPPPYGQPGHAHAPPAQAHAHAPYPAHTPAPHGQPAHTHAAHPAHAAAPAKPRTAAIVGGALGGLVLLGGVGFGGWYMFARDTDEEVAASEEPAPEPAPETTPETTGEGEEQEGSLAPTDPDLGELYRKVGAATVVVRVPGSVGSGAVIDPSGVILTNHHVIDGGVREGLSLEAKVVFGDYSEELHTFEPRHEQVDAFVIKIDEDHDLALLRLVDPPAALTHLEIAAENPYPGQRVAAIGHAGVGMLWAIKGGEVSAAGSLSGHTDLLLDAHEGDREYLEETKKRFEKMGRVIQSTAKILPGDSGGPLVNLASEIVGVNAFGRIDRGTNQWLSFHIHRAEVADFVAEIPERPLAVVPDPWDSAGSWSRVEDADLDGSADVLLLSGATGSNQDFSPWGALIDLDGDSFSSDGAPAAVNGRIDKLVEKRAFDPEFAVLHEPGGASHYWYDRDGAGGFDLYLVDEHGLGRPSGAWSLDAHGGAEKLDDLELGDGLRPELFTNAELQAAFRTIGSLVFPGQVEGGGASERLPTPSHQLDGEVEFFDGDGDGLNDTLVERSAFGQRLFFDLDQNSIARTVNVDALKVLLEVASVDAELALISQGDSTWAWYDRDDDGRFELVLHSRDRATGVAHEAFTIASPGATPTPAPEHVGRRIVRPPLLAKAPLAERLAQNPRSTWTAATASDDGLASFPSLTPSEMASILVHDKIALIADLGRDLTLVDVDGDSSAGGTQAVAERVRTGEYDAEFALLHSGGVEWAFYDRDDDGRYDWVRIALDAERDLATHVYEVGVSSVTLEPDAAGGALINWGSFTQSELREAFAILAKAQWGSRAREH
jgi:S1-C subfamily serine protease